MGEGPVQQKALIGPEDTTRFTGGFDKTAVNDRIQLVERQPVFDFMLVSLKHGFHVTDVTVDHPPIGEAIVF